MIRNILFFALFYSLFLQAEELQTGMIACEPTHIYKCNPEKCERIEVVNVEGVQYFEIDIVKKTLTGKIGTAEIDIENIVSRHGNENTFIFFGTHADSEFDWVLRINKKNGKMILQSTNEALDGFTTYGVCKWHSSKEEREK